MKSKFVILNNLSVIYQCKKSRVSYESLTKLWIWRRVSTHSLASAMHFDRIQLAPQHRTMDWFETCSRPRSSIIYKLLVTITLDSVETPQINCFQSIFYQKVNGDSWTRKRNCIAIHLRWNQK